MDFSKCKLEDCDPIGQVRGEMGEGDYFDVIENDKQEALVSRLKDPQNYHTQVELHDDNRSDIRIICRKCHRTTGWSKADAPGMPGVGVDFVKRKWDGMINDHNTGHAGDRVRK